MTLITTQSDQWIGSAEEIDDALGEAVADLDTEINTFRFAGPPCAMLFGNEADIVVTNQTFYFVHGEPHRLVDLMLRQTGRAVTFNHYA